MSGGGASSRARANHALYLARLVIAGWRSGLQQRTAASHTLEQAYAGGVRQHLVSAYGWFLLSVSGGPVPPDGPPRSCDDLPAAPAGQVLPAQINEFRQLEQSGWLAELLADYSPELPQRRAQHSLATDTGNVPGLEQLAAWCEHMDDMFSQVGDSLDEY